MRPLETTQISVIQILPVKALTAQYKLYCINQFKTPYKKNFPIDFYKEVNNLLGENTIYTLYVHLVLF